MFSRKTKIISIITLVLIFSTSAIATTSSQLETQDPEPVFSTTYSDTIEETIEVEEPVEYETREYENGTEYEEPVEYETRTLTGENTYYFDFENVDVEFTDEGYIDLEFVAQPNDLAVILQTTNLEADQEHTNSVESKLEEFNENYRYEGREITQEEYRNLLDEAENIPMNIEGAEIQEVAEESNSIMSGSGRYDILIDPEDDEVSVQLGSNSGTIEISTRDDFFGFGAVTQGVSAFDDNGFNYLSQGYGRGEDGTGITYDLFTTPELQYTFDDGDAVDVSGNNNDGVLEGDPSLVQGILTGSALDFDGSNDRIEVPDLGDEKITEEVTIASWVYTSDNDNRGTVISNFDQQDGMRLQYRPDTSVGDGLEYRAEYIDVLMNDYDLNENEWYFIVARSSDSSDTTEIFVNGEEENSVNNEDNVVLDNDGFWVGSEDDSRFWDGGIDNVMVFEEALTDQEIENIYNTATGNMAGASSFEDSTGNNKPYMNLGTFEATDVDKADWDEMTFQTTTNNPSSSIVVEAHAESLSADKGYASAEYTDTSNTDRSLSLDSLEESSEIQVLVAMDNDGQIEDSPTLTGTDTGDDPVTISYSEAQSEPPEVAINTPVDGSTFEYEWDEDGVDVDLEGQVSPEDESGTLSLELDGTEVATTSFSSDEFESLQTTENLDEGSYTLEVIADTEDHTVTDDVSFTVEQNDAEEPDVNMNLPEDGETFFYEFDEENTEVELQGSISSEDVDGTGRLYLDDEVVETNDFESGQVTEVQTFEDLDEGTYEVYTEAETELGDTFTSETHTFDLVQEDADEPTVAVNSPADGSTITYDFQEDNTDVEIEGQVSPADESGTLEVELDGTVIATESFPDDTLTSASSTETLDEGNYEVTVRAETDTHTVTESITFDIVQSDAEPPEVNLLEPEDGSTIEYLETADGTDVFHEFEVIAGDEDGTAELVVDETLEESFSFTGLETETFDHDVFQDLGTYEWFVELETEEHTIESETFTYNLEETDALSPVINSLDLTPQEEIGMNEDFTLSFDVEDPNEQGLSQINADLIRVLEDEENEPVVNSGFFDIEGTTLEDEISREDFEDNLPEDDDELFEEIGDYKIEFYVENDAGLEETQQVEFEVLSEAESGLTGALISLTESIVDAVGDFSDNVPNVVKYFISIAIGIAIGIKFRDSQHLAVLGMSSFFLLMAIVGWLPSLLITGLIAVAIILVGYSVFIRGAD